MPHYPRFVVVNLPGKVRISEGAYAIPQKMAAIDLRILCHRMKTVEGFWHRYQQVRACNTGGANGFSNQRLDEAILEDAKLAQRFIEYIDSEETTEPR